MRSEPAIRRDRREASEACRLVFNDDRQSYRPRRSALVIAFSDDRKASEAMRRVSVSTPAPARRSWQWQCDGIALPRASRAERATWRDRPIGQSHAARWGSMPRSAAQGDVKKGKDPGFPEPFRQMRQARRLRAGCIGACSLRRKTCSGTPAVRILRAKSIWTPDPSHTTASTGRRLAMRSLRRNPALLP